MEQTLSPEIEKLLQDLQAGQTFSAARIAAARKLGQLSASNLPVVNALIAALESDPSPAVRKAAAASLRASVHQEILQQHPDLMHRVQEIERSQPEVQAAALDQTISQTVSQPRPQTGQPRQRPEGRTDLPGGILEGGTRGLGNILVGIVFIIGGLSGSLVLRGTNSGELLALVGLGLIVWGVLKRTNQI
jgi:hypothetical protein